MSRRKPTAAASVPSTVPKWPTMRRGVLSGGRVVGPRSSMWLYKVVPLRPVVDASSPQAAQQAAKPLLSAFEELAAITPTGVPDRRYANRGRYRQVHLLLINVPRKYRPHRGPLRDYLASQFPHTTTYQRLLLLGVGMVPSVGWRNSPKEAVANIADTMLYGGSSPTAFDEDFQKVNGALTRAALRTPKTGELQLADSWWNQGDHPDTPYWPDVDHLHVFRTGAAAHVAERSGNNPAKWPDIDERHVLTLCSLQDPEMEEPVSADSWDARWVPRLLDNDALAVSIRGGLEPGKITRNELRANKKKYQSDVEERAHDPSMNRAEQDERLAQLTGAEAAYAAKNSPPTLVDTSVVAAFDGKVTDVEELNTTLGMTLRAMDWRQLPALYETMIASNIRANPHLHDLPAPMVALSGLPSLSRVGDNDGALLGFSERDKQPALASPTAASRTDSTPLFVIPGDSGSGKTISALMLADQFGRTGVPSIFIDPQPGSDLSAAIENSGGQVASLDQLIEADGIFDPLRYIDNPEAAAPRAASMIMTVNPFGNEKHNWETPLLQALRYGAVECRAECTGQALQYAASAGVADQEMVDLVLGIASAAPLVRAVIGMSPGTEPLRTTKRLTLIKVGSAPLDLPAPEDTDHELTQRVSLALTRMMVTASATALSFRPEGGVLFLDEAWVFLRPDNQNEINQLGRLARKQGVLPVMMTQKISDAVKAGLAGAVSRGLIMPLKDEDEARSACELFELAPTAERINRITAPKLVGGDDESDGMPNWESMHALRDPHTNEVLRGAVGTYVDLNGKAIPTEITIPPEFLARASTRPDDVFARQDQKATQDAARHISEPAAHHQHANPHTRSPQPDNWPLPAGR